MLIISIEIMKIIYRREGVIQGLLQKDIVIAKYSQDGERCQ